MSSSRDRPVDHRSEPMSCSTIARGTSVLAGARVDAREASARRSVADVRAFRRASRRGGPSGARVDARASDASRDAPETSRPRTLVRDVLAAGAALTVALTAPSAVWADDAAPGDASAAAAEALVDAPAPASSSASDVDEPEVVEFAFDDVEIGSAPDIDARKARAEDLKRQGLSELEAKAIENNQKIKQYNNAPAEFPTFVREGYDVKVITSPGFVTQDDGLVYKDFEVGAGPTPEDGQEVTFHYVAYNENGGTIDSTYRKNAPASTRLGINGMIPGFEEGLKGMREGGRRRVVVPPELGPPTGPATFFSAKQWEVFDIELIKIKNCSRVQSSFMSSTVVCE